MAGWRLLILVGIIGLVGCAGPMPKDFAKSRARQLGLGKPPVSQEKIILYEV